MSANVTPDRQDTQYTNALAQERCPGEFYRIQYVPIPIMHLDLLTYIKSTIILEDTPNWPLSSVVVTIS